MLDAAATFYTDLFAPCVTVSFGFCWASVVAPITFEDMVEAFSQAPEQSSPGTNSLLYKLVRLIVLHPECRKIALATFNSALSVADKGVLDLLKNWRPIALINTDAKVFTRILSARMIEAASALINPFQTGFFRGRFIAKNGILMKLVMEHAKLSGSSSIGLLLDQEKAYDRVHPTLGQLHFSHFFFDNHMVINVNGFLSSRAPQRRGLKQGDPISSILFNLAFEPLLRRILAESTLTGYASPLPASALASTTAAPTAVKMLAYADDMPCLGPPTLLSTTIKQKLSLSGSSTIFGQTWRSALLQPNIPAWHDARSPTPIRYLGFSLYTSIAQRNVFLEQLLDKVRQGCLIHQQRRLAVRVPYSRVGFASFSARLLLKSCPAPRSCYLVSLAPCCLISRTLPISTKLLLSNWIIASLCCFPVIARPYSVTMKAPGLCFSKPFDRLPKDFSNTVVSARTCLEIPLAYVPLPSSSSVELGRSLAQLLSSVACTMGLTQIPAFAPSNQGKSLLIPILQRSL
ncbi:hypothetical protein [Parasitella parasitica]|uniref:Reverse transcriptase domain-containing protein n=1 Tax=Parasitella parasitica TaxID=35722 RepID=A0A0B7N3G2_9FUNG|nr:hypothetical protein [Parasitella parasitica]